MVQSRGLDIQLVCAATPKQQETAFILRCSDRGDLIVLFTDAGQPTTGKYLDVGWRFHGGEDWSGRWRYSANKARPRARWTFWKFLRELENATGPVQIRLGMTSGLIPLDTIADALGAFKRQCPVLE